MTSKRKTNRLWNVLILISFLSCAQVGYVPLSDVSIDQEVQENHRETKKFMSKENRVANSKLPASDPLMTRKKRKKTRNKLDPERLQSIKKRVPRSQKKKFKNPKKDNG